MNEKYRSEFLWALAVGTLAYYWLTVFFVWK